MDKLSFVKFTHDHYDLYKEWCQDDEIKRWIGAPTQDWFDYVMNTAYCFTWMIYDAETTCAHLEVGSPAEGIQEAQLTIMVAPDQRRKGYARQILNAMLDRQELSTIRRYYAFIKKNNLANIKLFESMGYVLKHTSPDDNGYFEYELIISKNKNDR